jgi:hypothetical protein
MMVKNPISRKSIRQKRNPGTRNEDCFMDNGLVTYNVIDTTAVKLLDNVTLNSSHTTWNNSANRVPFSNK